MLCDLGTQPPGCSNQGSCSCTPCRTVIGSREIQKRADPPSRVPVVASPHPCPRGGRPRPVSPWWPPSVPCPRGGFRSQTSALGEVAVLGPASLSPLPAPPSDSEATAAVSRVQDACAGLRHRDAERWPLPSPTGSAQLLRSPAGRAEPTLVPPSLSLVFLRERGFAAFPFSSSSAAETPSLPFFGALGRV